MLIKSYIRAFLFVQNVGHGFLSLCFESRDDPYKQELKTQISKLIIKVFFEREAE